jgi:hypothetical protein
MSFIMLESRLKMALGRNMQGNVTFLNSSN